MERLPALAADAKLNGLSVKFCVQINLYRQSGNLGEVRNT